MLRLSDAMPAQSRTQAGARPRAMRALVEAMVQDRHKRVDGAEQWSQERSVQERTYDIIQDRFGGMVVLAVGRLKFGTTCPEFFLQQMHSNMSAETASLCYFDFFEVAHPPRLPINGDDTGRATIRQAK